MAKPIHVKILDPHLVSEKRRREIAKAVKIVARDTSRHPSSSIKYNDIIIVPDKKRHP